MKAKTGSGAARAGSQRSGGADPRSGADILIVNARLVDRDLDTGGAVLVRNGVIELVWLGLKGVPPEYAPNRGGAQADASGSAPSDLAFQGAAPDAARTAGKSARALPPPVILDAEGAVLMPSFIDLHAHFRDPGLTAKEDLETASRAACAGGYGTVVLMANTNPVCSDTAQAAAVRDRVAKIGLVDAFQATSLTRNFDGADTSALDSLDPAVVPLATEDGKEVASAAVMLDAMKKCSLRNVIVSCHCEDPDLAAAARPHRMKALEAAAALSNAAGAAPIAASFADRGFVGSSDFAESGTAMREGLKESLSAAERLLRLAEDTLTERNVALALDSGARVHIAHVSTAGSLESVRTAKRRLGSRADCRITCEVTPHHLALTSAVPAIVNPPLRPSADREALIEGILDGTVDAIATDHAPHTSADKASGAPGFSGIQTAFAVCNTVLVKTGRINLSKLSALMSSRPAEILGLCRGLLRPGYAADLVLIDPDKEWIVRPRDPSLWYSKSINTPFTGSRLSGVVLSTFRQGRRVFPFK